MIARGIADSARVGIVGHSWGGYEATFLPTRTNHGFVSSSLVREIASHGGDVSRYAPKPVCDALVKKFAKK